ncbi:MAG: hypothetical protein ABIN89_12665 [Chitinophagaceae bacterium]
MTVQEKSNRYDGQVFANAALASMTHSFISGLTAASLASIHSLENASRILGENVKVIDHIYDFLGYAPRTNIS